jgi:sucrose-6-phosphate hydrolase SacC (GH32 family)
MNDPNGLIQWKGTYLFYQINPNGPSHVTPCSYHLRPTEGGKPLDYNSACGGG